MILAAKYDATGIYGGTIVRCREVHGPQRWVIQFRLLAPPDETLKPGDEGYGKDQLIEREVVPDHPIPLSALGPYADECIADLFTGKDIIAKKASWRAYFVSDKGDRKRPKRRKRR